jgi:hypothetical protein
LALAALVVAGALAVASMVLSKRRLRPQVG